MGQGAGGGLGRAWARHGMAGRDGARRRVARRVRRVKRAAMRLATAAILLVTAVACGDDDDGARTADDGAGRDAGHRVAATHERRR